VTPKKTERGLGAPEPTAEGDIQMECSSDQLHSTSTGAVTKNYC
jgi:hypothetical protein